VFTEFKIREAIGGYKGRSPDLRNLKSGFLMINQNGLKSQY